MSPTWEKDFNRELQEKFMDWQIQNMLDEMDRTPMSLKDFLFTIAMLGVILGCLIWLAK